MKTDKDTGKVLSEGEELMNLVKGRGWSIVKKRLTDEIVSLGDIFSLTNKENLAIELGARQMATEILLKWLKRVEGDAFTYENQNSAAFRQIREETYIQYLED